METIDCFVIGAGVVGLAIARALSLGGREVVVAEREDRIGTGTSSRNSEVIHGGIYYGPGSLKARFCVEGRRALYAYCESRGVPHSRIGKLIVATSEDQRPILNNLINNALANGVDDLRLLNSAELAAMEPDLRAVAGIQSPSTGIVDSHSLMLALQGDVENAGSVVVFTTPVLGITLVDDGALVHLGPAGYTLKARSLINAAGLSAHRITGANVSPRPSVTFAKGNYFGCAAKVPFKHLVYPVPEPGGLGTHLTLDLSGKARFGPDVEWVSSENYAVDPTRSEGFYSAVRRYWPGLPSGALYPDYAGIRPKLNGRAGSDFVIDASKSPRLIELFGIESPGLTSALSIADHVALLTAYPMAP